MKLFKKSICFLLFLLFGKYFQNLEATLVDSVFVLSWKSTIKSLVVFVSLLTFSINNVQAQSALNTGSVLNISTNTTYSTGSLNGSAIVTIKSGATVTFTSGLSLSNSSQFIIEAGAKVIILSGGLSLSNNSVFTANGAIAIRGGGLSVSNNTVIAFKGVNKDTIIGNVNFSNDIATQIDAGVDLFIKGNVNASNNASLGVNGNLSVNGNYNSSNNVVLNGSGTLNTTGTITSSNGSTVFGSSNDCTTGPCNGNNLCGRTATATASVASVCSGTSVNLSAIISSGSGGTYQWQWSATSNGTYANLTTGAVVTISPTATRYYRVVVTISGCPTTSNSVLVTVNTASVAPTATAGTKTICSGSSTTLTASGGTLASDATAVWYQGASCGGFTQDFVTQPYSTNMTTVNSVNGILNVTTTGNDPMIHMYTLGTFNPNTYKYINMKYKVNSGSPGVAEVFFINGTYGVPTAGISNTGALIADGAWHVLTIDMSANASWTTGGNITGWRLDYSTPPSGFVNMDIDYLSLTSSLPLNGTFSPTANTTYLVRYEGICATTSCFSTNITVTPVPAASAGGSQTICVSGGTATVSGASSSNGTILWTHNGTGSLSNATTLTPTYTPATGDVGNAVTLTMTVSNAPCTAATATYTVNVKGVPTASAGGSQTICRNSTATVSGATSSNGTIAWTHNGTGSISGGSTLTPTYTPGSGDNGNTVTLTMTVSNAPCTAATATYTVNVKGIPSASAGGSQTICVSGGTATVSGASSNNGTIQWTHNGTGSLANTTTLTPTYTPGSGDAGNAVTLTMTVSNAPCAAATATYTVNVKGVPTASAGGSQTICRNGTATVSGASASNGTIAWTHNGTGSLSNATTLTPTYTPASGDAGNTVTLTMTVSNAPCAAATATYTVNVKGIPSASAGGSQTICVSGTATVSGASASNGTIAWTHNGAGSLANTTTLTPTYTPGSGDAGNTVTLTMTVSNAPCTAATATYTVNVKAVPTATAGGSQTICRNGTATVSGASSSNGTIAWTHNGAGSISGGSTLTPTYTAAAGDAGNTVTLTMTVSNAPCTAATATYTVNVQGIPTASAGGSQTICVSSTATVSGATSNNGTILWTHNGTGSLAHATTLTPTYTPGSGDAGNTVTLTMTVSNAPCTAATATYTVNVKAVPTAAAGGSQTICRSGTATVSGASSSNGTISWTHNGAGSLSGGTTLTPTYTPASGDAGNTVTLTMTVSNAPCTAATAIYTVNVKAVPTATAGGSQTICVSGTATVSGASSSNGTILWEHNGAGSISGATTLTPTYTPAAADAGNAVTLTMTVSNSPCTPVSVIYTVNVTAGPTAVAGTGITSCSDAGAVNITAGSGATNQSGIVWTTSGNGTFGNATSLTLATYTPGSTDITAGSVTLTLTATGNGACSGTTAVSSKTFTITKVPTLVSTTPGTRCGAGSVVLEASYDVGTLDWYAGPSGGPSLGTGTSFNTPSISTTTTYYVAASNSGCPSSRTSVVATVDNACAYTWTGTSSTVWNLGSNWSFGYVPTSINDVVIPSSVVSGNMPNITSSVIVKSLTNSGTINLSSSGVLNIYGNLSNTGTVATVSGSTISMVGSSSQTISGLTSAHNLSINNSAGVSLSSSLSLKGSLLLVSGVLTTNGNLVLDFDSGGNIGYNASDAGNVSGAVRGTRNLVNKTHYIANPFGGVTVSQIHATTPVYKNRSWLLATKNYGAQSWNYVKDSTTTVVGVGTGYSLAMYAGAPLTFTGTYSHTSSNYNSGSYKNVIPSNITKGMYFMMGNPYPSTLDWDNASGWTKTNINDAIYFWNPATSSVSSYVNGVGTNGATQYIPAMQSFLVTVTGTGGFSSLAVNDNARVLTNASYFRSSSQSLVRLEVRNATGSSVDETVVRMDDISTADYDANADAFKVSGLLSLYTKNAVTGPEYSINTLPISGPEMLIPLNLRVAANGLYTIECKEYSIPGYTMILEDKQTQSYTLMDNSTIYTLNATTKDSVNRFVLRFVAGITTGTTSGTGVDLQISTYENQAMLNVSGIQTSDATINIYDASGLNVMRFEDQSIAPGVQTLGLPGLPRGVYIVKVEIDAAVYVGKVVLK